MLIFEALFTDYCLKKQDTVKIPDRVSNHSPHFNLFKNLYVGLTAQQIVSYPSVHNFPLPFFSYAHFLPLKMHYLYFLY